jgi:arylsulfatase
MEGGLYGTDNLMEQINGLQSPAGEMLRHIDEIGGPLSNPHYPVGWAWAGNTPFPWGKRFGSHLGGTRDPMVVSWPGHIRDAGATRAQYAHVIDVFPTILEAARITQPRSVSGVEQLAVDGISFFDALTNASAPEHHIRQYFEMHGNLSMYGGGWVAARRSGLLPWAPDAAIVQPPWELYDLEHDYSEANDLARVHPEKLEQLKKEFDREALKNHVYPIDPRVAGREHRNPPPPGGRAFYTFYPGATHMFDATAPATRNRTHTLSAYIDVPAGGAEGVLVADGGLSAGYSLYVKDGRPTYTYNYFRREVTTIASRDRLPAGKSTVQLRFAYDGGGEGKGAMVTLVVNGVKVGEAHLAHTAPRVYSYDETFDVGEDSASPVGDYVAPFRFTGTLERLELRSEPAAVE